MFDSSGESDHSEVQMEMRILSLKDGVLRIAAANDDEVNEVIVSAGTWVKWFEPSKQL